MLCFGSLFFLLLTSLSCIYGKKEGYLNLNLYFTNSTPFEKHIITNLINLLKKIAKHLVVFGGVCGISPGNVASYSCDYNTSSPPLSPTSDSEELKSYVTYSNSQIYAGMKWQVYHFVRHTSKSKLNFTLVLIVRRIR